MELRSFFFCFALASLMSCGGAGTEVDRVAISTTTLADGVRGVPYGDTLIATGATGPLQWEVESGALPDGLTLEGSTGVIDGTPNDVTVEAFTVSVTSGDGQSDSRLLSISVIPPPTLQPWEHCTSNPPYSIATFTDAKLDSIVRLKALLAPGADLNCAVAAGLADALNAYGQNITSVVGVQNLAGLSELNVGLNDVSEIAPLAALTGLETLIFNHNDLYNLAPLSGLVNLTHLALDANSFGIITSLAGLTNLQELTLSNNYVTSVQVLSGLTKLVRLEVDDNQLVSASGLVGMTQLHFVDLSDNPGLIDIQALLDNGGLAAGDSVRLFGTGVSCAQVSALIAKGVTVGSNC